MSYVEERAITARLALGFRELVPPEERLRLVDWLCRRLLKVWHGAPVSEPKMMPLSNRQGIVAIPRGLNLRQVDEAQLHEATHFLLNHGAAEFFREHADNEWDWQMVRYWEDREEAEVRRFILALILPAPFLFLYRNDHELAELAGLSLELVQERRRHARGESGYLHSPPRWSAWWEYRVIYHPSGMCSRLRVSAHHDGGRIFEVPVSPADLERMRFQVNADLIALNADEFHAMYREYEARPAEDATLEMHEMWIAIDGGGLGAARTEE